MKIKTADLTGAALDWAVAKCERRPYSVILDDIKGALPLLVPIFSPSTSWQEGGPIIEREAIELVPDGKGSWSAAIRGGDEDDVAHGPTPLIAAMRCYVTSRLGDEVDIPEELV
jgi:hypothetical protein